MIGRAARGLRLDALESEGCQIERTRKRVDHSKGFSSETYSSIIS
jgi:hypothetical protein